MNVAIDPGHGMANASPGVFDPGAVNQGFREADVVLPFAFALEDACGQRGWRTFLTRRDNDQPRPLANRVAAARAHGCELLVSLHCNAWHLSGTQGTETLYGTYESLPLAEAVQKRVVLALSSRDRGTKERGELAILKFGPAVLVELGFLTNTADLARLMLPASPRRVAAAICNALEEVA
ncbi:MAG: N-acetylmuramoyl-L-alanine amidase [Lautropia sp.]